MVEQKRRVQIPNATGEDCDEQKLEGKQDQSISDDGSSAEEEQNILSLQKLRPKLPRTFEEKTNWPRVYVILEAA